MIELQNHRIALAALDAWVVKQKLPHEDAIRIPLQRIVPLISLKICLLVVLVMLSRNLASAGAASRVALSSGCVLERELVDRLRDSASCAHPRENTLAHAGL